MPPRHTSQAPRPRASSATSEIRRRAELIALLLSLPWIDAGQVALIVGCSVATVRRACAQGQLRHTRIGPKLIRTTPAWLKEWAERPAAAV